MVYMTHIVITIHRKKKKVIFIIIILIYKEGNKELKIQSNLRNSLHIVLNVVRLHADLT